MPETLSRLQLRQNGMGCGSWLHRGGVEHAPALVHVEEDRRVRLAQLLPGLLILGRPIYNALKLGRPNYI